MIAELDDSFPSKLADGLLKEFGIDSITAQTPLRRIGDDDELKGVARLVASSAGKHITRQIIPVDGGMAARSDDSANSRKDPQSLSSRRPRPISIRFCGHAAVVRRPDI